MSKITQSARNEECQVRLIGICNHNSETTVFAHYRKGGLGGMGKKPKDIFGAYACSACHDVHDGRVKSEMDLFTLDSEFKSAVLRTQEILVNKDLIKGI